MANKKPNQQNQKPVVNQTPVVSQTPVDQPAPVVKKAVGEKPQFTFKDKTYSIKLPKMNIPGIGILTAADVATDEEAQKYLVENNTIGSAIELVVE